jgi:hypothetical protein
VIPNPFGPSVSRLAGFQAPLPDILHLNGAVGIGGLNKIVPACAKLCFLAHLISLKRIQQGPCQNCVNRQAIVFYESHMLESSAIS